MKVLVGAFNHCLLRNYKTSCNLRECSFEALLDTSAFVIIQFVTLRPAVLPTVQLGDGVHEELQLHRGHGRHQGAGPVLQPAV